MIIQNAECIDLPKTSVLIDKYTSTNVYIKLKKVGGNKTCDLHLFQI